MLGGQPGERKKKKKKRKANNRTKKKKRKKIISNKNYTIKQDEKISMSRTNFSNVRSGNCNRSVNYFQVIMIILLNSGRVAGYI